MALTKGSFSYTDSDYSLKGFVETFASELPVVIRVTEGYIGLDDPAATYEYGAGDVYRVHGIKLQPRVLATETGPERRSFSIPLDYPMKFNLRRKHANNYTDPMPISEIVEKFMKKTNEPFVIFIADPDEDSRIRYWDGPDKQGIVSMVEMDLELVFQEKYLMVHTLADGKLIPVTPNYNDNYMQRIGRVISDSDKGALTIPVYLPIKVEVAIGMQKGTKEDFQAIVYDLYMQSRTWAREKAELNNEVLLFNGYDSSGNYDYVAPRVVLGVDHTKPPAKFTKDETQNAAYGTSAEVTKEMKPLPTLPDDANATDKFHSDEPPQIAQPIQPNVQNEEPDESNTPPDFGQNWLPPKPKPLLRQPVGDRSRPSIHGGDNDRPPPPRPPPPKVTGYCSTHMLGPLPPVPGNTKIAPPTMLKPSSSIKKPQRPGAIPISPAEVIGGHQQLTPTPVVPPVDDSHHPFLSPLVGRVPGVSQPYPAAPLVVSKPSPPKQGILRKQANTGKPLCVISPRSIQQRLSSLKPVQPKCSAAHEADAMYGDLSEVPANISTLTVKQLADCLCKIKLHKYAPAFEQEDMDGEMLVSLDDKAEMVGIMESIFFMNRLEAIRLWNFAHGWRCRTESTPM